jgi:hypothetical protein
MGMGRKDSLCAEGQYGLDRSGYCGSGRLKVKGGDARRVNRDIDEQNMERRDIAGENDGAGKSSE